MSVIRVHKTKDFTVMSNTHLRDKRLSLKAKGLLSLMFSLPDDWNYSIKGLISICTEKESAILSTLKELKDFKYIRVDKLYANQTESGRIEYVYNIFEKPYGDSLYLETKLNESQDNKKQGLEILDLENQGLENQGLEDQGVENQGQLNTNILNTNILNTNRQTDRQTREISEEAKFYINIIKEKFKNASLESNYYLIEERFLNLIEEISHYKEISINNYPTAIEKILKTYLYFFTDNGEKLIAIYNLIDEFAQTGKIKNKFKYTVSTLYNTAING